MPTPPRSPYSRPRFLLAALAALALASVACDSSGGGGAGATTLTGTVPGGAGAGLPLRASGSGIAVAGQGLRVAANLNATVTVTLSDGRTFSAAVDLTTRRFSITVPNLVGLSAHVVVEQNGAEIFEGFYSGLQSSGFEVNVGAVDAFATAAAQILRTIARNNLIVNTVSNLLNRLTTIPVTGGNLDVNALLEQIRTGKFNALATTLATAIGDAGNPCTLAQLQDGTCAATAFTNALTALNNAVVADPPVASSATPQGPAGTVLVSVTRANAGAGIGFAYPKISNNGAHVVWSVFNDTDFVAVDNNGFGDGFFRDIAGSTTEIGSLADDESLGNESSNSIDISGDGNLMVFSSIATNLVSPPTTSGRRHVYVRNRTAGTTTILSRPGGVEGNGNSFVPRISNDGMFVIFASLASNLVAGDTNGTIDAFRVEVANPANIVRASVKNDGSQANWDDLGEPTISANGSVIAFNGESTDAMPSATGSQAYVRNLTANTTTFASPGPANAILPPNTNFGPVGRTRISGDGNFVAFTSYGDHTGTDSDGMNDVYVYDIVNGTVSLVSVSNAGANVVNGFATDSAISGDGRYVTFTANPTGGAAGDYDPAVTVIDNHVYVRDRTGNTTKVVARGDSSHISNDGGFVAMGSGVPLAAPDTNPGPFHFDVYRVNRP